uniref:Uncharacterized protein n=1 Tax=Red panda feces-associated circular DNA virus 18 TaxID=2863971 RepID=A0A8K1HIC5_9VIRU|nr:hypothetical protein [Red panda feces-associated circular DNA virus 18]
MYSHNGLRPTSTKQVHIWNRYNNNSKWEFVDLRFWPRAWAQATLNSALSYTSRYGLFCYLVGNGMEPNKARNAILGMGAKYFDSSAREHVRNLAKDVKKNARKWQYYDEIAKKRLTLDNSLLNSTAERPGRAQPPSIDRSLTFDLNRFKKAQMRTRMRDLDQYLEEFSD